MKSIACALAFLAFGVAACGAGTAGKAVRPTDPTANDALGKNTSCKGLSDEPQLLTLDWDDTLRIDLEQGMKKGVVAVKYDCDGFKILRDCDVPGSYEYAGFSPAKTTAKIQDDDQLQANLPIGAAKMSAEIKRGSTIDLVYLSVGQQTTTVHDVPTTKLSGKCEGATHTVRSANLGAFAMTTGAKGDVNAAVQVLGRGASGESSSNKSLERTNGELDACEKASDSATEPTSKCKALVQLLLSPIGGKVVANTDDPKAGGGLQADPLKDGCPTGFAADKSGLCQKKDAAVASICVVDNFDDCKAQCEKGNAPSCYNAGANRMSAKYNTTTYPDKMGGLKESYPYFDKACQAGNAPGCGRLGVLTMIGQGTAKDPTKAETLMTKGCAGGDAWTCRFLSAQYEFGKQGFKRDLGKSFTLTKRACALGDQHACISAARDLMEGVGVAKDLDGAVKLLGKACDAGDEATCERAKKVRGDVAGKAGSGEKVAGGGHVKFGVAAIDNPCGQGLRVSSADSTCVKVDSGTKFVCDPSDFEECKKLCDGGDGKSCYNAAANRVGKWNIGSKTGPEDAYPFLEKSCTAGYAGGCGEMANALSTGTGVKASQDRSIGFFDKACTGGDTPSCHFMASNYLCAAATCNGVKKNPSKGMTYYKKGCDLGDVVSCKDGADTAEHGSNGAKKDVKGAKKMLEKACTLGDQPACDHAKDLKGGKKP